MSQPLPAFFPAIRNPEIRMAPITSGASWFAAIYWRNDAITDRQYHKLINSGFVPGKAGRLFYPRPMDQQEMEGVCRLLGGSLEVLKPEQTVVLESGEPFEGALPDEVRQGIAWWWRHNRQAMAQEIKLSLEQSADEGVRAIADQYSEGQWRNPDRLKQWVSQALDGDLEPVTEPIVGLGLSWAIERVGQGSEMPPELAQWRKRLADHRGETLNETVARPANLATQAASSRLPRIGQRISWRDDDNSTLKKGVVKRHSEETGDQLWVMPNRPHYVVGLTMPQLLSISTAQLLDFAPTQAASRPIAPSEATQKATKGGRTHILPTDIPSSSLQHMDSEEYPPAKIRNYIQMGLASQHIRGTHPLSPFVDRVEDEAEMVMSFKSGALNLGADLDSETPVTQDARHYIRDTLLEEFNTAQPAMDLDTDYPALAVIPINTSVQIPTDRHSEDDIAASIDDKQLYGVGIHPRRAWKLIEEIDQWRADHVSDDTSAVFDDAVQRLVGKLTNVGGFNIAELVPGYQSALRQTLNFSLNEDDQKSASAKEAMVQGLTRGVLHHDLSEAGRVLQSIRDGKTGQVFQDRAQTNNNILKAIANASDRSMDEVGQVAHPMLWISAMLAGEFSRQPLTISQSLAVMGIDLSVDAMLSGEIAEMNEMRLVTSNREIASLGQVQDSGAEKQQTVGEAYTLELSVNGESRYVTLGVELTAESPELTERGVPAYKGTAIFGDQESRQKPFDRDEGLDAKHKRAAMGRILAAHSLNELPFHAMPTDTPVKDMTAIPVRWTAIPYLGYLSSRKPTEGFGDPVMTQYLLGEKTAEPVTKNVDWAHALNGAISKSQQAMVHSTAQNRSNPDNADLLKEAIRQWVNTQYGEIGPKATQLLAEKTYNTLVYQDAEMISVAIKKTARRIYFDTIAVSFDAIKKADFNRFQAGETAIYEWSRRNGSGSSRYKMRTFDALSALKPHALNALNEVKKERVEADAEPAKKAKGRQNTGMVHGLSMKDLRGTRNDVLDRIAQSDATERKGMITKTRLWQTPDWIGARSPEDGSTPMDPVVACFWNQMRKQLPSKPPADLTELNRPFAKVMLLCRDWFDDIRTSDQLTDALAGEFGQAVEDTFNELKDADIPVHQIFGKQFRFAANGATGLKMVHALAKRESNDNQNWPASVGKKRVANAGGNSAQAQYGAMPMLTNIQRTEGKDHRQGRDITEQDLLQTFGFSGVEYGESMPQRERTLYLNHAYDALMDMAQALDAHPQTLSMGGTLGLAFGSRGRGGRNAGVAHFEPDNNVINLTRMKGAGSLAHEFGHTIANYFSRQVTGQQRGPGDLAEMVAMQQPMGLLKTEQVGRLRKTVYDAFTTIMANICYEPINNEEPSDPQDKIALGRFALSPIRFGDSRSTTKGASTFLNEAVRADQGPNRRTARKSSKPPYFANPKELFARSFETWIHKRLSDQQPGYRNDYLVRPDKIENWSTSTSAQIGTEATKQRPQLYPAGEHLDRLDYAFRNLFEVVETGYADINHEHLGKTKLPYLYSHDESVSQIQKADRRAFAECAVQEVARMCGEEVVVNVQSKLTDPRGTPVGGRFLAIDEQYRDDVQGIRALIEVASSSPLSNIYHEAFHFAQTFLITDQEQKMLDKSFETGAMLHERLSEVLVADDREHLIDHCDDPREAQAYAYQQWVKGNLDLSDSKPAKTVFEQVQRWCRQVSSTPEQYGFESIETLFQNFYDGRLVLREQQALMASQNGAETPEADYEQVLSPGAAAMTLS